MPSMGQFAAPPDPGQAGSLDDLVERLRLLKVWAGDPSFERIKDRINAVWREAGRPASELPGKTTVVSCFRQGRVRVNTDLLIAIVEALHPEVGYVAQWRQALRVIGGEVEAAAQVRVQDTLPPDLVGFTGRATELGLLAKALHEARHEGGAVVSAIEGMAGVGKTQLAIRAAHLLMRDNTFDQVLFVDLRGFHPDRAQPPADPAAVLDGFLRLLGVPGQQIPHDLSARTSAYRRCLKGTRALVVLDNAADAEQARPLVADLPGCLTLVTSRRGLAELRPEIRLAVDVFTAEEAVDFLTRPVPGLRGAVDSGLRGAVDEDAEAAARIAARCGHLPLALSLVAGHIRSTPGWTLTDHADRLDERHRLRQLDTGVQLALDLSYQDLPAGHRRLLRLAALHPGQDFDAHAAAALAGAGLPVVQEMLRDLCRDHLLRQAAPDRYSFHDLVRAYAADRAVDEDRVPERRLALTRLFDFYLATASTAMDVAFPHERQLRPAVAVAGAADGELLDQKQADDWLDTEMPNLLAAAQHAAVHGRHEHTWQLSAVLEGYLRTRSRYQEAQALHERALDLARQLGNDPAEMNALNSLGHVHRMRDQLGPAAAEFGRALEIAQAIGDLMAQWTALIGLGHVHESLGRHESAAGHFERALGIARAIGDRLGERNALNGLGHVHRSLGNYEQADTRLGEALRIAQAIGDRVGELNALTGLGYVHRMLGGYTRAAGHFELALQIAQTIGDRVGELNALSGLGHAQLMLGIGDQAADHCERALRIARDIGNRIGELSALMGLGDVHRARGRDGEAAGCYQQVLDHAVKLGNSNWRFEALQGLGRLHRAAGRPALALAHHEEALQLATDLAQPPDQARAHDGLADAHHALEHHDQARGHWQQALDILTGLGTDHTEEDATNVPAIRAHLARLAHLAPPSTLQRGHSR